MSDSESFSEREPNAFDEELSDGLFDSDGEEAGPDAEGGSDIDVEILGEGPSSIPTHGVGKGLMTAPVPLSIVYSDGRHVGLGMPGEASGSRQSETSTSGRGESAAKPPSGPRVSVVYPSNLGCPWGCRRKTYSASTILGRTRLPIGRLPNFEQNTAFPTRYG
ncbi:unnamed protein product [Prunus armeniaca]